MQHSVEYWTDSGALQRGPSLEALDPSDDKRLEIATVDTIDGEWDRERRAFVVPPPAARTSSIPVSEFLSRIGDYALAVALTLPDPKIGFFRFKLDHATDGRISLTSPSVIAGVRYLASLPSLKLSADDVTRILAPVEG